MTNGSGSRFLFAQTKQENKGCIHTMYDILEQKKLQNIPGIQDIIDRIEIYRKHFSEYYFKPQGVHPTLDLNFLL